MPALPPRLYCRTLAWGRTLTKLQTVLNLLQATYFWSSWGIVNTNRLITTTLPPSFPQALPVFLFINQPTMSAGVSTLLSGSSQGQNTRALFRVVILVLIAGAAVASRLFSVIRESTCLASPMKLCHVSSMACNIESSNQLKYICYVFELN